MQLTLREDPIELEGTLSVCLRAGASPAPGPGRVEMPPARFVVLKSGDRCCGACVQRVESGPSSIEMDKYLRVFLQARVGDPISVEYSPLSPATSAEILVPAKQVREGMQKLVKDRLAGKPIAPGQPVPVFITSLTGEELAGEVTDVQPASIAVVSAQTQLTLRAGEVRSDAVTYESIGGLSHEIERIREIVEYPLRHPDIFQQLGITSPHGVILYGPPGTGKTLITKAVAHEAGASVVMIQGPEIISGWYGDSEHNLRQKFDEARSQAPAIILIDEIDSIAPRRDRTQGEVEHRVVATLLTLMDGMAELKDVVVIGTTNAINAIDPALRRPGRFEHEIHIGVPDTPGRREILRIHTRRMPLAADVDLDVIADRSYGFVGADLASLCRQAAYCALRRVHGNRVGELRDKTDVKALTVAQEDFEMALAGTKPSATREIMVELPRDVTWDSIGGLEDVKRLLIENVVYGMQRRDAFLKVGIKAAKGVLLHGPPGTGKTLLAKVTARESGANFIAVRGPEVRSKWYGESEEKVRFVFAKAREVAPCIILFDELDAVAPVRGREASGLTDSVVNQLLAEMDGIEKSENVFVIGTTNKSELIDQALLRPGRFDYQILVPLPDPKARASIFAVHLKDKPVVDDLSTDRLVEVTEGFSGADIAEACRLATLDALRGAEFNPIGVRVSGEHLEKAIAYLKQTQIQLTKKDMGF